MKKEKKQAPAPITSKEYLEIALGGNYNISTLTIDHWESCLISFAKLKVTEALEETSKHFKNPENVSYIKNHYNLDKIV